MDHGYPAGGMACLMAALLAGCAAPGDPRPPGAEAEARVAAEAAVLVDGTFDWHGVGLAGSPNLNGAYSLASQAVAHPCVWDGPSGPEPYFNNLQLPLAPNPYPPWPGNLSANLEWAKTDWVGTHLRLAYREPASDAWHESRPVERGATLTIPFQPEPDANATDAAPTDWSVWVCLPTDTLNPEAPFVGSVTASVAFQPDPLPASLLGGAGSASERTSRP